MGDLAPLAGTRRGRYVQPHMPASMQALRLAGDTVMTAAGACRQPGLPGAESLFRSQSRLV